MDSRRKPSMHRMQTDRIAYCRRAPKSQRRGAIVVWFLLAMPALLTLLCVMIEVAHLYLARAELHNALESAAQAAVKDWAENFTMLGGEDTQNARIVGNTFAMANSINGDSVNLANIDPTLNYDAGESCNQNGCSGGVFVFGAITDDDPKLVFDCCTEPEPCNGGGGLVNTFAVRAQATYPVPAVCSSLFGIPIGPFTVTARADALYDCSTQSPRLYHLEPTHFACGVTCP